MSALIVCAGGNENFSFAKGVGIGLFEASLGLYELCFKALNLKQKLDKIIFIGTCGLYDEKDELLKIYESSHCFNIEFSKLCGNFYSPISNEIKINVSRETYKCNSSNFICADKKAARKFSKFGLKLENMELFSILKVAEKFKISATSYLCATNFCDEKAHENFIKNHAFAKKKLENFLQEKNLI